MDIQLVHSLLLRPQRIVITSHRNPDGDALGCSLGLQAFLQQYGHTVKVIFPSDYPDFFAWMPQVEDIIIYDKTKTAAEEAIAAAEVVFCLDYNSLDRVDKVGELFMAVACPKLMIDHHLNPEPFANYLLSDTSASSTSELIVDFIHSLGADDRINVAVAECLLTGIITDTGSFKFATSPKLFRTVAHLLEKGADLNKLQDLIFNSLTEKTLRLLGYCLYQRFDVLPEYKVGIISLSKRDFEQYNIQRGDTEGIVNYILMVRNLQMAIFVTEQPNIVKLSFRSKGDLNVEILAKQYFKGGGHKNAAGGYAYTNLSKTLQRLREVLPGYLGVAPTTPPLLT